jgi:ABC-type branched-subunit amino acid transport system substrate-binding protein
MLKRLGAAAGVAAAFAVLVAATLGSPASAKADKTTPLCKKAGIGFAGPLSGGASFLGTDQSNWVKLFISSWNGHKKIPGVPKSLHRVKLTLAKEGDSQLSAQVAQTVARQMVSIHSILGMVGFAGSNENLGGGPTLDAAKLPYVSGSATLDTLATGAKGQKPLKYFYRVVPQNAQQARTGAPFIINALKLKKGAKIMVVDDGEAYGIGLATDAQKLFTKSGMKVTRRSVKETDQNPGGSAGFAADIAPVAQQAVAAGAKLVYAPTQDPLDSQTFANDLKIDGYHGGYMATDGSVSPTQFTFSGAYISFFGPSLVKIKKSFRQTYLKRYGQQSATDPFGAPSFVAAQMLGVAISKACAATHGKQVSRAAVAKTLKKVKLSSTILGYSMAFNNPADARHGPKVGVTVFKIQPSGAYKEVFPK